MSHEVQIIWQTPGTEPFASVQWDDGQPDAILIMAGMSRTHYEAMTKKLPMAYNDKIAPCDWLLYIVEHCYNPIKSIVERLQAQKEDGWLP